ncbi:MAG TPA: hypothetical protein VEY09_12570 [Pyrinomonadaceae bacterium]|nr:hypothetical protein [Pyrinomonadaceae bacterium]
MRLPPSGIKSSRAARLAARLALAFLSAVLLSAFLLPAAARAQQVADDKFAPPIAKPAHKPGRGPVVALDEAHNNFHTASGRYLPFAELLRRDGYRVRASTEPFSRRALKGVRLLVVANALGAPAAPATPAAPAAPAAPTAPAAATSTGSVGSAGSTGSTGSAPAGQGAQSVWAARPSAFSDEEVAAVREWVRGGGSLLLIVDHMPMPGAAAKLAAAFGAEWSDGFALDGESQSGRLVFVREDGTLRDHKITRGRSASERVERVVTFTGSAFRVRGDSSRAEPLLVLPPQVVSLTPEVAWQFTPETPRLAVGGWLQGAVFRFGRGRVALFGEAAMFTAQLAGPDRTPAGMNAPDAPHNAQFLLNLVRWLTGKLK